MELADIIARVSSATQADCDELQAAIAKLERERDAMVLERNKRIDALRSLLRTMSTAVNGNHRRLPRPARKTKPVEVTGKVALVNHDETAKIVNRGFGEMKEPVEEGKPVAYDERFALAGRIIALLDDEGSLPLLGIASRLNAMIPMVRDVLSSDKRFKQEPSREWGLRKKG